MEGLSKLLKSLDSQDFKLLPTPVELEIIVIDNDNQLSAKRVVENFKRNTDINTQYICEPLLGIPVARNRGLDAVSINSDFICFIDDDEWPEAGWLYSLLKCQEKNNADAVLSGVKPIFESTCSPWVVRSRLFEGWSYPCDTKILEASTNNVLIRHQFIKENNLRFDERMLRSGGSDYLFFKIGVRLGMKIFWTNEAYVSERIPKNRANLFWIIKRQFRLGNTFAVAGKLLDGNSSIPFLFVNSILRICTGLCLISTFIFSFALGMRACSMVLRGAGMLFGVFGGTHYEYLGIALLKDRRNS
jgi:glycosyltransferase involved in cell wall biosynthesis